MTQQEVMTTPTQKLLDRKDELRIQILKENATSDEHLKEFYEICQELKARKEAEEALSA